MVSMAKALREESPEKIEAAYRGPASDGAEPAAHRLERRFVQAGLWEIRPEWVALSVRYDGRIAADQD